MPVPITREEILETIRMVELEGLDIRAVTLGIDISDCSDTSVSRLCEKIQKKILHRASRLRSITSEIETELGIPIVNARLALTPLAIVAGSCQAKDYTAIAEAVDEAGREVSVDFVGGFGALVQKGATESDSKLIDSIPRALSSTERVCSCVNLASTRSGINMDIVARMGEVIRETAELTADRNGIACCRLTCFANAPEDNPFMAGAFHGVGEPDCVVNIGVSGPGVVRSALNKLGDDADLGEVAELVKRLSFKITRMGELVGREVSARLGAEFGIVDLSLAPTPLVGDSVAETIEAMGLERCGAHGSIAAFALLVDAVKKGGAMASSYVGGLSGGFLPVSEDVGIAQAVKLKALSLATLEAMTGVCSVGLDMVPLPGNTPPETISGIIADELAIGVINGKAVGVRLIPVPGKKAGDVVEFGGLLGSAPVMPVSKFSCAELIRRGGRIPAPISSLTN